MSKIDPFDPMKGMKNAKLYRVQDQHTGDWYEYHIVSPETASEFFGRKREEWRKYFTAPHRPELVTMSAASTAFAPSVKAEEPKRSIHAQKIAGERPDRNHVFIPLVHSVIDAGVFIAAVASVVTAFKYIGLMQAVGWVDLLVFSLLALPVGTWIDWHWFGNRSIMSEHVLPDWIEPKDDAPPPAIANRPERIQVFARVEDSSGHVRTAGIVPTDEAGGLSIEPERVLRSCASFHKSGSFSQPKSDGLSSSAFGKLKNHWEMLKLIEPDPKAGEGRYKLTRHGRAIIKAVHDGQMTVD